MGDDARRRPSLSVEQLDNGAISGAITGSSSECAAARTARTARSASIPTTLAVAHLGFAAVVRRMVEVMAKVLLAILHVFSRMQDVCVPDLVHVPRRTMVRGRLRFQPEQAIPCFRSIQPFLRPAELLALDSCNELAQVHRWEE